MFGTSLDVFSMPEIRKHVKLPILDCHKNDRRFFVAKQLVAKQQ